MLPQGPPRTPLGWSRPLAWEGSDQAAARQAGLKWPRPVKLQHLSFQSLSYFYVQSPARTRWLLTTQRLQQLSYLSGLRIVTIGEHHEDIAGDEPLRPST